MIGTILYFLLILVFFFWLMEAVAWAAHKYLMHGFLWFLHEDHHKVEEGFFQKNDFFFLLFAIPSWLCLMLGGIYVNVAALAAGTGILLYGLTYFFFHEVLVHRRFPKLRNVMFQVPIKKYFRAIEKAHKAHHRHTEKEDGESFGLLIFDKKHFQADK